MVNKGKMNYTYMYMYTHDNTYIIIHIRKHTYHCGSVESIFCEREIGGPEFPDYSPNSSHYQEVKK